MRHESNLQPRIVGRRTFLKYCTAHWLAALAVVVQLLTFGGGALAQAREAGSTALQGQPPAPLNSDTCKVDRTGAAKPGNPGKSIFYGDGAPYEKATVGISYQQDGKGYICTGVIISNSAVLTAGHCSCGNDYRLLFGEEMGKPVADIGIVSLHRFQDRAQGYSCNREASQPGVDYALLKFDPSKVGLDDDGKPKYDIASILPPRTAQKSVLNPSAHLRVVGYGLTEDAKTGARKATEVPVLTWDCAEGWASGRGCEAFSEIILSEGSIGFRTDGRNRDSCGGDSGGPAFAVTIEKDACERFVRHSYLVAITSRGMKLRKGEGGNKACGGGGIYEVVARKSVLRWLAELGVVPTER